MSMRCLCELLGSTQMSLTELSTDSSEQLFHEGYFLVACRKKSFGYLTHVSVELWETVACATAPAEELVARWCISTWSSGG